MRKRGLTVRYLLGIAGAVATALVVSGCGGGSTEPNGRLSGTYDLTLLNGQTLPSVYLTYGIVRATKVVVGGSLEFSSRDRAADSRRLRDQPGGVGGLWSPFEYNTTVSYHTEGDRLIIQRPGLPGQPATYADTGLIDGDIVHVPVRTIDGQGLQVHTLTYVKREGR